MLLIFCVSFRIQIGIFITDSYPFHFFSSFFDPYQHDYLYSSHMKSLVTAVAITYFS